MPRYDSSTADCRIFTFKEGLLSAVAHDLELVVGTFEIDVAEDRAEVSATFDPGSIRVVDAVVDGRRSPGTLSDKDKKKIEANIVSDVLGRRSQPIRFRSSEVRPLSSDAGWEVRGELTLTGRTVAVTVPVRREPDALVGEVTLHQPDFGIKPYSAMLGALKVRPDVRVRVRMPLLPAY